MHLKFNTKARGDKQQIASESSLVFHLIIHGQLCALSSLASKDVWCYGGIRLLTIQCRRRRNEFIVYGFQLEENQLRLIVQDRQCLQDVWVGDLLLSMPIQLYRTYYTVWI